MQLPDPVAAAILAFAGVVVAELVVVQQEIRRRGPGNVRAYTRSWFFWLTVLGNAAVAGLVGLLTHENASRPAWFVFGVTFRIAVGRQASEDSSLPPQAGRPAPPDPPKP